MLLSKLLPHQEIVNHFASPRTVRNWPSACSISTSIIIFPTTDRYQMRSGQQSKLRLSILPRDTNTLAVVSAQTHNIDGLVIMSLALSAFSARRPFQA